MKIAGYIITAVGVLAAIGAITAGHNFIGPMLWIALGVFLILRAYKKKKDDEDLNKWNNSNQSNNV